MQYRPVPLERLDGLQSPEHGLTTEEADARRRLYGANDILEAPPDSWRALALETARDPMLWFLVATSILFAFLGDYVEALTLLGALIPLVGMDAYLHRRTQASTRGLASRLASRAKAVRDGALVEMPAWDLVPGDLAVVGAGEPFPADGLLVGGKELQADEAVLTGESLPVRKQVLTLPVGTDPAVAAVHWAAAGTRLLTGEARLRVVFTGGETLYGEIVRTAVQGGRARTPLQAAIANLVAVLLVAALIVCLVLAAIRLRQGHGLVDAVLSAVTLAVAALPEEFPVVFTFFLGVGVYRLARRQALVRRAVAVENIGRVTCIATDKTGTLTEGRLVLAHRVPAEGIGADRIVGLAALAARHESGDPLDGAILAAATDAPPPERLASFPFTEDRRRETAVWRGPDGACFAAMKGAPETVLSLSLLDEAARASWRGRVADYAATGHKVIACATRTLPAWSGGEPDRDYAFAGLLAFEDPVRPGVRDAVLACRKAGIRVMMVTGDHPATAAAIAREIGLGGDHPRIVAMDELPSDRLDPETWRRGDVIARAIPAQKLAVVQALQSAGEIVAVTGDGVNDVPALQAADVGIAMGERGTRTAREVAAIVLLDDNLRTIVRAIAEGRQLFRNLQLSFAYLLMVHIPLVLSAAIVPLAGYPLLYLPIHIVWLELIIHPTALLVFQELPASRQLVPIERPRGSGFFTLWAWLAIGVAGAVVTAVVVFGYDYALGSGRDVEHARAMALVALVTASATITASLSGLRTWTARIVVLGSIASLVGFVQVPGLAGLLHIVPLHLDDWAIAAAGGVVAGAVSGLVRLSARGASWRRGDRSS